MMRERGFFFGFNWNFLRIYMGLFVHEFPN
jgi:hypothetical protein